MRLLSKLKNTFNNRTLQGCVLVIDWVDNENEANVKQHALNM